jgi:CO/xanthine dehydrogenase Mo-binding subunit
MVSSEVWVEYDPLPAAVTIDAALAPTRPWSGRAAHRAKRAKRPLTGPTSQMVTKRQTGQPVSPQPLAARRCGRGPGQRRSGIERTFTTPMVHHSYLETQSVVVLPDPLGQGFTVYTSTQAPFYIREEVAAILGLEETAVRVIPTKPGGAFGGKFLLYELLIALVSQQLGRPVSLSLTRGEELLAGNPAPAATHSRQAGGSGRRHADRAPGPPHL